jgi:hypothetical protein
MWDRTGIPVRTIQDIERETFKLSLANAEKISAATGVSTDYLLANDPNREITNIAGESWSEKDVKAIKQRAEEWPRMPEMEVFFRASFFNQMVLDYYKLRRSLLATRYPFKALDSWREHREKAWVEFLKEWPTAKWENPEAIKPANADKWKKEWEKDFRGEKTGRYITKEENLSWEREIETAKHDAEFVLAHPLKPRSGPDADAAMMAEFRILGAARSGEPVESGDPMLNDFLESERAGRRHVFKSYTFDGFHDGAKMPQELVGEAISAIVTRGTKPDEVAENEGAPAKRHSPKKQR